MLQVKNSDNSENSSSKTVRDGTEIQHWYRRFSRTGATNWPALNDLVGIKKDSEKLSENSFRKFVRDAVSNNPGSVFLEEESPLSHKILSCILEKLIDFDKGNEEVRVVTSPTRKQGLRAS